MSRDYYKLLTIPRDADYSTICEAYRTLALEWHPLKHPDNKFEAFQRFNEVAEAFDVLSNGNCHPGARKSAYDQFGEYGLKNGVPDANGGHAGGYRYGGDANEIFNSFFGTRSPFANTLDSRSYLGISEGYLDAIYGDQLKGLPAPDETPPEDLVVPVICTLEELYNGCKKTATYTRRILNQTRTGLSSLTKTVEFEIKKGHFEDIVYPGEGHESAQYLTSKLVLHLQEVPHPRFIRKDRDLVLTLSISLLEALLAHPMEFVTLDSRRLTVSFDQVISPKTRKFVENEGMPIPQEFDFSDAISKVHGIDHHSPVRGRLIIKFDIQFPKYVPEEDKEQLRVALNN